MIDRTCDIVSGCVIGGDYRRYVLMTPAGKKSKSFYADDMTEAQSIAEAHISDMRREYPEDLFRFGYDGQWELREY